MTADRLAQALERMLECFPVPIKGTCAEDSAWQARTVEAARADLAAYRSQAPAEGDAELRDRLAEQMQAKADNDQRRGALQPVSYYVRSALIHAAASKVQPKHTEAAPSREHAYALHDAMRIAAADRYFAARAWMLDTSANRRVFEAGFDAGAESATQAPAPGAEPTDEQIDNLLHALPMRPWGIGSRIPDARAAIRAALAAFRAPAVKAGETLQTSMTQQADAHLRALLRYTENFYGTAIEHGMKAGPTANAIAHVERAGKALHQIIHAQATMLAASQPPVQPMGDANG